MREGYIPHSSNQTTGAFAPGELQRYRETASKQHERELKEVEERLREAWVLAHRAAALLKERYGATRVAAFGSITQPKRFHRWSDVDLAAWGLPPDKALRALGEVYELGAGHIPVNLVDVGTCRLDLLDAISREGVDL